MPRPPPPAEALIISGYPMCAASFASCSSPSMTPSLPGMVGRPAVFTSRRAVLLSHHFDDFGPRANERDFRGFAYFGEVGVFRKEPVAGMDGIHIRDFGRADHLRNVQITFAAPRGPDTNGLIGKPDMERVSIRFGINRDRRYP